MVQIARSHLENFSMDMQLRSRLACKRAWWDEDGMRAARASQKFIYFKGGEEH